MGVCYSEWSYVVLVEFNGAVCDLVYRMHFLSSSWVEARACGSLTR